MLDIDIIEDSKEIISETSIRLWKNDPVFEKLFNITNKSFIKDRVTVIDNKQALSKELDHIIKKIYEHGYYKGLRSRGDINERESVNNWDAKEVYPEASGVGTGSLKD